MSEAVSAAQVIPLVGLHFTWTDGLQYLYGMCDSLGRADRYSYRALVWQGRREASDWHWLIGDDWGSHASGVCLCGDMAQAKIACEKWLAAQLRAERKRSDVKPDRRRNGQGGRSR